MSKQAVIFDLDGTLLNTLEDLCNSTNYALETFGYPARTLDEVRTFVGNGVKKLVLRALNIEEETDNPDFPKVFAAFQEHYKEHSNDLTGPYPGVMELLQELHAREIPMAIVSNKLDPAVKALNEIYFKDYITVAIGENEAAGVKKKPAPDTVYAALSQLGCEAAVYVGDSEVDLATAKNSGLPCLAVTWGFRDEDWLLAHGAEKLFRTPQEVLEEIIRGI
jgi:phosphoglycolate phosphatase